MKVFLSWSGEHSKQIASVFKDWLPSVIQSIDPFISSEDIEKGSRWNTEIAQKLQETSFGIIFLTKDNLNAPWLNFEAGALSKALNNSYVAPFLYDIKPSDLTDSPISQFQTTSFTDTDLYKLMETINNANGPENLLPRERLRTTFDIWYPKLVDALGLIAKDQSEPNDGSKKQTKIKQAEFNILEDILESTRNTQRLLGNTDMKLYKNIEGLQEQINLIQSRLEKNSTNEQRRGGDRINGMFLDEFLRKDDVNIFFQYKFLIVIGLFREDYPWIYDAGKEFIDTLKNSKKNKQTILRAQQSFLGVLELTSDPMLIEVFRYSRNDIRNIRELVGIIANYTQKVVERFMYDPSFEF